MDGEKKEPLFPHSMWNKWEEVRDNEPTTNNSLERYHGYLHENSIGKKGFWHFVLSLREYDGSMVLKYMQLKASTFKENNKGRADKLQKRYEARRKAAVQYSEDSNYEAYFGALMSVHY